MKKFQITKKKKFIKAGAIIAGLSALALSISACQGGNHPPMHKKCHPPMHGKDHPPMHNKKIFKKIDLNSDGVLTKDEFRAKLEKKFSNLDSDSNGEVTKKELEEGFNKMERKKKRRHDFYGGKDKMFGKMDLNLDGIVTKSELSSQIDTKFDKLDKDGNGEVTKGEFRQHHRNMIKNWKEKHK